MRNGVIASHHVVIPHQLHRSHAGVSRCVEFLRHVRQDKLPLAASPNAGTLLQREGRILMPPAWQTVSLFNPVVYLVSGFRWSFYENADVSVALSLGMTITFLVACLVVVHWIFRTGYKLRS